MGFSSDYLLLLLLFYVLIIEKVCNCGPIYNNSQDMSNMSKWYYSPENGKFIIRNTSMTSDIFSQDPYTQTEEIVPNNTTIGIIDVPQCPDGESYCENISNYPYQRLHEVLKSNVFKKNLFRNTNHFGNLRGSGVSEEDTVCRSIREVIRPMVASNDMGKRKFILNQETEEEFVQEIHLEKCQPGIGLASRCAFNPPAKNKKSGCKQKYLSWRLLSFSVDGEVSYDTFSFPSGCSCIYTLI